MLWPRICTAALLLRPNIHLCCWVGRKATSQDYTQKYGLCLKRDIRKSRAFMVLVDSVGFFKNWYLSVTTEFLLFKVKKIPI